MTELKLTKERFRDDTPLKDKALSFDAMVEMDRQSIAVFQGADLLSLTVFEARELRDWLNKVLP